MSYGNQSGDPGEYDPRQQPDHGQPGHGQPGYGPPPGYGQPGGQPGYGQPGYGPPPDPGQMGGYPPQGGYAQAPYGGSPTGYGPYPPGGMPPGRPTNGMAVASLVLGIVGLLFTCGITSIPGAILGHMALGKIRDTGEEGRSMAIAGLVLSYIAVALWIILWLAIGGSLLAFLGLASTTPSTSY